MSSKTRKLLVDKLRAEGHAAQHAGKPISTCPHQGSDRKQWLKGYRDGRT
jgi:ribosome modulation factor